MKKRINHIPCSLVSNNNDFICKFVDNLISKNSIILLDNIFRCLKANYFWGLGLGRGNKITSNILFAIS